MIYTRDNIVRGGMIYCTGDTIAALITGEFSWYRLLGILIIGATVYAYEIPNYFIWIDKKITKSDGVISSIKRALLAMLYFNPIWIARHMVFILLLNGAIVDWSIIKTATISFLVNIPILLIANYIIQNRIAINHRFVASAIFSGLMAIYYAMSYLWFS